MLNFLVTLGVILTILGFLIMFLAMIVSVFAGGRGEVKKGAVLMIGPIPIILADDPKTAKTLMILAVVLTLISFLLVFIMTRL